MCVEHQQVDVISIDRTFVFTDIDVAPFYSHLSVQIIVRKHISMQVNLFEVRAQVLLVIENFVGEEFSRDWIGIFVLTRSCNRLTTHHRNNCFCPSVVINHYCLNPSQIARDITYSKHEIFA